MRFILRFLISLSYLLPFTFFVVTCDRDDVKFSFNREEAEKNIALERKYNESRKLEKAEETGILVDTVGTNTKDTLARKALGINDSSEVKGKGERDNSLNRLFDRIMTRVLCPTKTSLSGIGSIFYFKNPLGKMIISICLGFSIILLIPIKLFKRKGIRFYSYLSLSILLMVLLIESVLSDVSLLWGFWVSLALTASEAFVEYTLNRKSV